MQERNINLNSIIGMDLRDFNLEQQYVTEIVNLVKDKNGWKIRNPIKSIWTIPTDLQAYDIQNLFKKDTTAIIHIGNSILFYKIENNTISEFIKRYDYNFSFKLFETNFSNVYYMIDQTNSKNYILEFTDRLGVWIDDVGSPDLSTELLYHEYDTYTGDTTWGAFGKYKGYENNVTAAGFGTMTAGTAVVNVNGTNITYNTVVLATGTTAQLSVGNVINVNNQVKLITSVINSNTAIINSTAVVATNASFNVFSTLNGQTYNNHLNTYLINYDSNNVADMYVKDYINGDDIHLSVTQDNNRTRFQMTNPGEVQPEQWVDRVDYTGNVFGNSYSKFMSAQVDPSGIDTLGYVITKKVINGSVDDDTTSYILTNGSIYKKVDNDFEYVRQCTKNQITEINNVIYDGFIVNNYEYYTDGNDIKQKNLLTNAISVIHTLSANEAYTGQGFINWDYNDKIVFSKIFNTSTFDQYLLMIDNIAFTTDKIDIGKLTVEGAFVNAVVVDYYNPEQHKLYLGYDGQIKSMTTAYGIATETTGATIDGGLLFDGNLLWTYGQNGYLGSFILYPFGVNTHQYVGYASSSTIGDINIILLDGKITLFSTNGVLQQDYIQVYNYNVYVPDTDTNNRINKYFVNTIAKSVTKTAYKTAFTAQITHTNILKYIDNKNLNISYLLYTDAVNNAYITVLNKKYDVNNYESTAVNNDVSISNFNIGTNVYGLDSKYTINDSYNKMYTNRVVFLTKDNIQTIDLSLSNTYSTLNIVKNSITNFPENINITSHCNVTLGNIDPLTNRQRVYVTQGKEIWVFTLEDGVMLDPNEYFDKYTIPTISRYADVDGGILSHKLINEDGYVLTEINQSKKIPIRPYFSPKYINVNGTATLDTLYAVTENIPVNQLPTYQHETMPTGTFTTLTATMTVSGTTVTITGGDATQLFKIGDVIKDSAGTMRRITNIYNTTSIGCVSGLATGTGAIQLSTDKWELNQLYGYRENNLIKYRTPVDIDNGSYFNPLSDNNVNYYQYWMMYILNAGLLDDDFIDEINLTVGKRKGGNYDLYYWAENPQYVEKHYGANSTQVDLTGLPFVFSNKAVNDTDSTNVNYIFCKNNKVFWRINDRLTDNNMAYRGYQDGFYGVSFWETKQAQRWLIQDLVYFANDLVFALDYDGKLFNYSYGIKLLDRSAYKGLTSKPVGIYEYSNGKTVTICENDIYVQDLFSGANYDTILNQKIATNIGIEKNNYNAIVSNGVQTFFENKNGVYMISNNNLVNIGLPIEDYLYKDAAIGKRLGIDTGKGIMLIPLDANKINNINIEYKNGDYGTATADGNIIYDKYIGVYNYIDNAWSIWAFNSNTDGRQAMESFDAMPMIRVNNALVIPDFRRYTATELASATENPIARIIFKRTSMGDAFGLTLLRYLLAKYKNNLTNGVDYVKIKYNINDSVDYTVRYGDFRGTGYTEYSKLLVPDNTTTGWTEFILPMDIDFRTLRMALEFGRIKDSVYADVSLTDIALDTIDKGRRRLGFN